jgi:hypothetical protein
MFSSVLIHTIKEDTLVMKAGKNVNLTLPYYNNLLNTLFLNNICRAY